MKKEGENNIKNVLRFIISKGFDIEQKNNNEVSFRELCCKYDINNYLDEVLLEFQEQNQENDTKIISDINAIKTNKAIEYINIQLNKESSDEPDICRFTDEMDKMKIDNKIMKNNDENKMLIDSDNLMNNNNNEGEKITKINNNKNDFISEANNDDYYFTFSEISSINANNNDNNDNTEKKDNSIFNDNNDNDIKNRIGKCCLFVDSSEKIVVNNIFEKIKKNRKLKNAYLNKIIHNKDNDLQKDKSKIKKLSKKKI
jgi:hypothetical protein